MALVAVLTPSVEAAAAGFALSFSLLLLEHVCLALHANDVEYLQPSYPDAFGGA